MSADLQAEILAELAGGSASIQGLAAKLNAPLEYVRLDVFAMASSGHVEHDGRNALGAPTWRLPIPKAAKVKPPKPRLTSGKVVDVAAPVIAMPPPTPSPFAPRPPTPARPPVRGAQLRGRADGRVEVRGPVTPAKLRYARWFLDADWPLEDVADLFDLFPNALARAVNERRVA